MAAVNAASKAPTFTCTDSDGVSYKVWISAQKKLLQVQDKGTLTEITLADPNYGRPSQTGTKLLIYNGWNAKAAETGDGLQMAHEFITHYFTDKKSSRVQVSLVVDHRERLGLSCRSGRSAVTVVTMDKEGPPEKRYAEQIREAHAWRSTDGRLWTSGAQAIESALRRYSFTVAFKAPTSRAQFIEEISEFIKRTHPDSIKAIGEALPQTMQEFWKNLLAQSQYAYFPEVQRYTGWVQEAKTDSILSGFTAFTSSAIFKEKDIRDFFIKEVTPVLKNVSDEQAKEIKEGLSGLAVTFFSDLWTKAAGKRTLSDYPDIESMARNIAAAVEQKEFEPERIAGTISAFLKSQMAFDADARKLFLDNAGPQVKSLSPRQKEDVLGWLDPAEKEFFAEMQR